MQSVHLQAPARLLGTIQPVRIIDAKQLSLTGTADLVAPDLVAPNLVSEEAA
jgi:tRNA-2-methylthio-N6-dimethylallyladenosine synthase